MEAKQPTAYIIRTLTRGYVHILGGIDTEIHLRKSVLTN